MIGRRKQTSANGPIGIRACDTCGFGLFLPIHELTHSLVGLYDDARFPGRCIVSLGEHFEHLEDVPPDSVLGFMMDIRRAALAIRNATGCSRVNVAILGNAESHVHAHLIPRYPEREARPNKSPWNDPRPQQLLAAVVQADLIARISDQIDILQQRRQAVDDAALFDL